MNIRERTTGMILGIAIIMAMCGCSANDLGADGIEEKADESGTATHEAEEENDETGIETGEAPADSSQEAEEEESQEEREEAAALSASIPTVPQLPRMGRELSDFVLEGWELMDSVELDFNQDGIMDYVGVQEADPQEGDYRDYPRILFAIASDGKGRYQLDFQDENLIRTRDEGGVFGDPYCPLTAEGVSFTTHTFGGSAWKWSEDFTYTYSEGNWYLIRSEETYGYGWYTTSYSLDDWEKGTGIRKKRSSDFSDMEKHWDEEGEPEYDLVYELSLEEPLTLLQAGRRWWLAPDRVTDWEVRSIEFAGGIKLSKDIVRLPDDGLWFDYCDEDCVLYTFSNGDSGKYYLAMYRWQDKTLLILAEADVLIDDLQIYKGKIYYTTEIVENAKYRTVKEGKEQTEEQEDTIGIRLNRMNTDGTGKEVLFEYLCPEAGREVMESRPPYLALIYEISGDEIVTEVYNGDGAHPFYRMNTDGSGLHAIGQIPKE